MARIVLWMFCLMSLADGSVGAGGAAGASGPERRSHTRHPHGNWFQPCRLCGPRSHRCGRRALRRGKGHFLRRRGRPSLANRRPTRCTSPGHGSRVGRGATEVAAEGPRWHPLDAAWLPCRSRDMMCLGSVGACTSAVAGIHGGTLVRGVQRPCPSLHCAFLPPSLNPTPNPGWTLTSAPTTGSTSGGGPSSESSPPQTPGQERELSCKQGRPPAAEECEVWCGQPAASSSPPSERWSSPSKPQAP